MYCIYTDREYDREELSLEHIIPLSLGGSDGFAIQVGREINSKLGYEVDGPLANDFLVLLERIQKDARGHSGVPPALRLKKASVNGRPASVTFCKDGIRAYDPVEKTMFHGKMETQISTVLKLDLRVRFAAKVALGAGYFLFGDRFRTGADCDALRRVMLGERSDGERVRVYDAFCPIKERDRGTHGAMLALLNALGSSSVIVGYGEGCMVVYVALLGSFAAMVNFQADVKQMMAEEDTSLGVVLQCRENQLYRASLRDALEQLLEQLEKGEGSRRSEARPW